MHVVQQMAMLNEKSFSFVQQLDSLLFLTYVPLHIVHSAMYEGNFDNPAHSGSRTLQWYRKQILMSEYQNCEIIQSALLLLKQYMVANSIRNLIPEVSQVERIPNLVPSIRAAKSMRTGLCSCNEESLSILSWRPPGARSRCQDTDLTGFELSEVWRYMRYGCTLVQEMLYH